MKMYESFIKISLNFVPKGPIDNNLWTNVDPVHWHIYAALGGDELSPPPDCYWFLCSFYNYELVWTPAIQDDWLDMTDQKLFKIRYEVALTLISVCN